jgi:Zn-dependent peptidase ImmA (M78 family)
MVQRESPGAGMVATRWVDASDPDQQRAEWEANWFAAAFLMPSDAFRRTFDVYKDVARTAAAFGVSEQAAEIRARSIGLG